MDLRESAYQVERNEYELRYLRLLSERFPTKRKCLSEIVNLNAILGLPKGTEYFFSDIHGEDKAFIHLLRSSSGIIKDKIDTVFEGEMDEEEKKGLCELIYYPKRELKRRVEDPDWDEAKQKETIYRLIRVCRFVSKKYTRSKVRKKMPEDYAYILEEMLHTDETDKDKEGYFLGIIDAIVKNGAAASFTEELCDLINDLTIDSLHIIGDIFDRGPRADLVMEELMRYRDVDIQWGNHDISWMGAFCGNEACVCNVLRTAISYNSFDVLEDGYGINLRGLSMFAQRVYGSESCERFLPHLLDENVYDRVDARLAARMYKAITIIQLKYEGQLIRRHPEYDMDNRLLLDKIDFDSGTVEIDGMSYELLDKSFPTIDREDPYRLTVEEEALMETLRSSFMHSPMLRRHVMFLYSHGSIYKCINGNLLYHGCIPMEEDGSFTRLLIDGETLSGKALMDRLNDRIKDAYFLPDGDERKRSAVDLMWYLWCGKDSPLFGKDKMATFESCFLAGSELKREQMDPYYVLSREVEVVDRILEEFGLSKEHGHIVNGHVPVKRLEGELPYKAGGKLFVIDGGLAKSYQKKTGIAGYTLIYNSQSIALAEHRPYVEGSEATPNIETVEVMEPRVRVAETDIGRDLKRQIEELRALLDAYRKGFLKEKY